MTRLAFSHVAISCQDPDAVERFYSTHFGFKRARVYVPGPDQVVMLKAHGVYLELFHATQPAPAPPAAGAGPEHPGWRHVAFLVDDLTEKLAQMGQEARITLGPVDMSDLVPGMHVCWLADPEGNIVELNQGYRDQEDLPEPALAGGRQGRTVGRSAGGRKV
jgi:glyoxylase I family protein